MPFILNKQSFLNKVTKRNKTLDRYAQKEALLVFRERKNELLENFDNHEITQELKVDASVDSKPDILGGRSRTIK
jgi:hypothetical protein